MPPDDWADAVPWGQVDMTLFLSQERFTSLYWRFLIISALPLVLLIMVGCARIRAPQGWSGGAVVGDVLYIGTAEGELVALDRGSGERLWKFELRGVEETDRAIYGTPAVADNTVYIGGYDSTLYALSLDDQGGYKELKWQERLGDSIIGSPVVADGLVLVGSSDGNLYAFDVTEGGEEWKFSAGDKVWSTPAVVEGVVFFGSIDGNVYAVSLEDGRELWRFPTKGAVAASPTVAGGRVYVGSFDSVFYAIDAQTGQEFWRFKGATSWFWGRAIAADDTVYAPSLDGNLYALDIDTGRPRWTVETEGPIAGSPVIVHDMIAVASDDGKVRLARLKDGSETGGCDIGEKIRSSLVEKDGFIYLGARDGSVRALKIETRGDADDVWVRFTDKGVPEPESRGRLC